MIGLRMIFIDPVVTAKGPRRNGPKGSFVGIALLMQGSVPATRGPHKPKTVGSTPTPATTL